MSEPTHEHELALIDGLLADVGALRRWNEAEAVSEQDGRDLLNGMRSALRELRASLAGGDEQEIVLTDAGGVALMAFEAARQADFRGAVRRSQHLMTGRALMERGVDRARLYGPLAAIDGGRP